MVRYAFVAMAGMAAALPLNINLGAYSPALVVGDGEISFGGNQDVANLMNVLEGAAVNTAASVANNAATTPTTTNNENAAVAGTANNAATTPAGDKVVSAAADPLLEQAQQIASLQGLGKEIAPRVQLVDVKTEDVEVGAEEADDEDAEVDLVEEGNKVKRDLAGFDRALTYAEAALTKGPKVQLGTGKEGSGVGIIVDNNQEAAARAGTAKRDVASSSSSSPKRVRAKVTTMYVRSGIPASLQSKRGNTAAAARSVPAVAAAAAPPAVGRRDAIDGLNLNVDGDQGLTMTFVETVEDGEDD